jgi:hypothetical protein
MIRYEVRLLIHILELHGTAAEGKGKKGNFVFGDQSDEIGSSGSWTASVILK